MSDDKNDISIDTGQPAMRLDTCLKFITAFRLFGMNCHCSVVIGLYCCRRKAGSSEARRYYALFNFSIDDSPFWLKKGAAAAGRHTVFFNLRAGKFLCGGENAIVSNATPVV